MTMRREFSTRPPRSFRKLSVLVAAFNEEPTLEACVTAVLAAPLPAGLSRELVIVDDGSTDGTWQVVERLVAAHPQVVRGIRSQSNRGKGAAIRRAIAAMTGDLAIFQDADLEYDPADYPRVLGPILDGRDRKRHV